MSLRRRNVMCTYHSILSACLPELVKMSASRGEKTGRKYTLDNKEAFRYVFKCKQNFSEWDCFGCWEQGTVNKPTPLLFSTSSMTVRVHSQLILQPLQLSAAKCPAEAPDTVHHCELRPLSNIQYGWKRIESGARIGKYCSCSTPCWLVLIMWRAGDGSGETSHVVPDVDR